MSGSNGGRGIRPHLEVREPDGAEQKRTGLELQRQPGCEGPRPRWLEFLDPDATTEPPSPSLPPSPSPALSPPSLPPSPSPPPSPPPAPAAGAGARRHRRPRPAPCSGRPPPRRLPRAPSPEPARAVLPPERRCRPHVLISPSAPPDVPLGRRLLAGVPVAGSHCQGSEVPCASGRARVSRFGCSSRHDERRREPVYALRFMARPDRPGEPRVGRDLALHGRARGRRARPAAANPLFFSHRARRSTTSPPRPGRCSFRAAFDSCDQNPSLPGFGSRHGRFTFAANPYMVSRWRGSALAATSRLRSSSRGGALVPLARRNRFFSTEHDALRRPRGWDAAHFGAAFDSCETRWHFGSRHGRFTFAAHGFEAAEERAGTSTKSRRARL